MCTNVYSINCHFLKVYYLIFHPVPSPPLNPMITAVNKTTIDLQWTVQQMEFQGNSQLCYCISLRHIISILIEKICFLVAVFTIQYLFS